MTSRVLLLCLVCFFKCADSISFVGGNVLTLLVTSNGTLSSVATVFSLEERNSTSGFLMQPSINVTACTLSGNSTREGQLSQSPNGGNSAFACYRAIPGAVNPALDGSVERGAAILNFDATIGTLIRFGASYQSPARGVYSAVVADASGNFFVAGDGQGVRGEAYAHNGGRHARSSH